MFHCFSAFQGSADADGAGAGLPGSHVPDRGQLKHRQSEASDTA